MKGVGTSGADRGQVGAGAEGAAFAPQHGDRGGRVRVELAERVGERPRGGAVDGVPYVGAVQDDRGHRTVAFDAYRHEITVRVPSVEYGVAGRGAERLASGEEPAQPLGLPSDLRYGGGLPQAAAAQRAERPAVECGAAGDVDQGTGHVDVEPESELVPAGKSGIDQRRDEAVVRRASGAGAVDHGAVPAGDGAGVEADGGLEARCERRQAAALDDERTLVAKLLDGGGDRRRHPVPVHFPVPGRVSQEPFPGPAIRGHARSRPRAAGSNPRRYASRPSPPPADVPPGTTRRAYGGQLPSRRRAAQPPPDAAGATDRVGTPHGPVPAFPG